MQAEISDTIQIIAIVTPLITTIGSVLLSFFIYRSGLRRGQAEAKKTEMESEKTLTDAALTLLNPIKNELKACITENRDLEIALKDANRSNADAVDALRRYRAGAMRLYRQLESYNIKPVWHPDDLEGGNGKEPTQPNP